MYCSPEWMDFPIIRLMYQVRHLIKSILTDDIGESVNHMHVNE